MSWFSFLKSAPKVTPELIEKRLGLLSQLTKVYHNQITHLAPESSPFLNKNEFIFNQYQKVRGYYKAELESIDRMKPGLKEINPDKFEEILTKWIATKTTESVELSTGLLNGNQTWLNDNYNFRIHQFLTHYHFNRIESSFELSDFLYDYSLRSPIQVSTLIDNSIKYTENILSLNGYPIPNFINADKSKDLKIICIAPHIQHIIFELLKNSTIPSLKSKTPVTISYQISENDPELVEIKLSDQGGGLVEDHSDNAGTQLKEKIFHFHFTTTPKKDKDAVNGFGMGLPLCKVFALFNRGDLKLVNNEGVGVDVYITLPLSL